jgi:hypothetical protein
LDVHVRFVYNDASKSVWYNLDNRGDDREQGDRDEYELGVPNASSIVDTEMRVRHEPDHVNDDVWYDAWYFQWMRIETPARSIGYDYDGWVKVPQGQRGFQEVSLIVSHIREHGKNGKAPRKSDNWEHAATIDVTFMNDSPTATIHWTIKDGRTGKVVIDEEFQPREEKPGTLTTSAAGFGEILYKHPNRQEWSHKSLIGAGEKVSLY